MKPPEKKEKKEKKEDPKAKKQTSEAIKNQNKSSSCVLL